MAGIKGKNTRPEILVRKLLHSRGFRFRLHGRSLPGKPDLVFRKYKAVIFVNGCFWHRHNCHLFKWPLTRKEFWKIKIRSNKRNDIVNIVRLKKNGWRALNVWECALKGKTRLKPDRLSNMIASWLVTGKKSTLIRGK